MHEAAEASETQFVLVEESGHRGDRGAYDADVHFDAARKGQPVGIDDLPGQCEYGDIALWVV